jgi:hypothetical protein
VHPAVAGLLRARRLEEGHDELGKRRMKRVKEPGEKQCEADLAAAEKACKRATSVLGAAQKNARPRDDVGA